MENLISKKEVVIDSITMKKDFIKVRVDNVVFNGDTFNGNITYYTSKIESVDGIDVSSERVIKRRASNFTVSESDQLEASLGVVGNTVSERLKDLVVKTLHHQVGVLGVFGLTSDDFEIES